MPRTQWTSQETRALIDERKNRNQEYHDIEGTSKRAFWESVAANVNRTCGSAYTGVQCQRRFGSLVTNYDNMRLNRIGDPRGHRNKTGRKYFAEFDTRFWELPRDEHDDERERNERVLRLRDARGGGRQKRIKVEKEEAGPPSSSAPETIIIDDDDDDDDGDGDGKKA